LQGKARDEGKIELPFKYICSFCGKTFYGRKSKNRKYCSHLCYSNASIGRDKGKIRSKETKEKIKAKRALQIMSKRSEDFRLKQSINAKKQFDRPGSRQQHSNIFRGRIISEHTRTLLCESKIGGFWYGNVRYDERPQYCERWTEDLRERVRAYFGYRCFECGALQNGTKLSVHHVHYNKKTCCDGSPHDIIPLCVSCHMKTNGNRDYWEKHFTDLLYASDPDGKCFFTKEEMKTYTKSTHF